MNEIDLFDITLNLMALAFFMIAFIITFRLWFLTDKEKYWIRFPIAMFCLILHELVDTLTIVFGIPLPGLRALFEMLVSFFLIYTAYELSKILVKINDDLRQKNVLD